MSISSRFAVAVHILTMLERARGEPVTSEAIARSANTNPAVIRRLQCMLARAGLTTSRRGPGGGALLARPAGAITLRDVYLAVEDSCDLFAMHHDGPNPRCAIGRSILLALEETTGAAREAMEAELARWTLADVVARVESAIAGSQAPAGR